MCQITSRAALIFPEKGTMSNPLETHRELHQVVQLVAEVCLKDSKWIPSSPWSSAALSKCAKSHLGATLNFPENEPGPICLELTGDLYQVVGKCAWRWQVDTTLSLEAALPWVNVPNHVWSHPQFSLENEPWPICSKLTGDLPMMRAISPEDGRSIPLSPLKQCYPK